MVFNENDMRKAFKFNFEFKKPKKQNAPSFKEIRAGKKNQGYDSIVYCLTPVEEGVELMEGDGILWMQELILSVFQHFTPETLYLKYTKDQKIRKSVTSGVYNILTMEMVQDFQKTYLKHFKRVNDQIPTQGFGSFGGHTKTQVSYLYNRAYKDKKGII